MTIITGDVHINADIDTKEDIYEELFYFQLKDRLLNVVNSSLYSITNVINIASLQIVKGSVNNGGATMKMCKGT